MPSIRILLCFAVLICSTAIAEPLPSDYHGVVGNNQGVTSQNHKGIRYAGPIVYTNEKPPMIHFPPPPAVSTSQGFNGIQKGKSVKYVPMPTHDLPILIYQSDISPPLHVVSPPSSASAPAPAYAPAPSSNPHTPKYNTKHQRDFDVLEADYSNQVQSFSTPHKSPSKSRKTKSDNEGYRTLEQYPKKPKSQNLFSASALETYYNSMFPLTQSIKNFLGHSSSPPRSYSHSASSSRPMRKNSGKSESLRGEYSTLNEVYVAPKTRSSKQSSKSKDMSPLPHIIYTGHAPIHIFNQAPIHVPTKTQGSTSTKSSHELTGAASAPRPSYERPNHSRSSSMKETYSHTSSSSRERDSYHSKPHSKPKTSNSGKYNHSYKKHITYYQDIDDSSIRPTYATTTYSKFNNYNDIKPANKYTSSSSSSGYKIQKPSFGSKPKSQSSFPLKSSSRGQQRLQSNSQKPSYSSYSQDYSNTSPSKYKSSSSASSSSYPSSSSSKYRNYSPAKPQYTSAPSAFKKPPIIIYQGLYPPHHVYENPPTIDYRVGQAAASPSFTSIENPPADYSTAGQASPPSSSTSSNENLAVSPEFTSRMSPDAGEMVHANVNTNGYGLPNPQPTYWLPPFGMTMYVSDLTSQGTAAPQFQTDPTAAAAPATTLTTISSPQTHNSNMIQIHHPDGTYSTAQVTTLTSSAEQSSNPSYVNHASSAEARIDSIPTHFLASSVNNQNNPLIPMSYSSIILQSAGAQPTFMH